MKLKLIVGRGTYREVEFASFRDFFRKNLEELEDARYACWFCAERRHDHGEDIVPIRHADGQLRQADVELCPYQLEALAVLLEQVEDGVT